MSRVAHSAHSNSGRTGAGACSCACVDDPMITCNFCTASTLREVHNQSAQRCLACATSVAFLAVAGRGARLVDDASALFT